jgi:hypothetical protein
VEADMTVTTESGRKAAYYYAHQGDGDIFKMAVGGNLPRMRKLEKTKQGRGPIPVLARDEEVRDALQAARKALLSQYYAILDDSKNLTNNALDKIKKFEAMRGNLMGREPEPKLEETLRNLDKVKTATQGSLDAALHATQVTTEKIKAIEATEILGPKEMPLSELDPDNTKLYMLGHGGAGTGALQTTTEGGAFTFGEAARGLKKAGLHQKFKAVNLPSCESADATTRTSFAAHSPAYSRDGTGARRTAPAQILADELYRAGFTHAKVKGYQGMGVMFPPGETAMSRIHVGDDEINERRSRVATVFKPKRRQFIPMCLR